MGIARKLEQSARKAAVDGAKAFSRRYAAELEKRIPTQSGELKESLRFGKNGSSTAQSVDEAIEGLDLGDAVVFSSTSEYWLAVDAGLHVGADGRPKGSRQAPNGISAEALAAAARRGSS